MAHLPLPFTARRRALAGFTLIELLIVIIIVGILMAIGIPAYLSYQAKAKDADAKTTLMTAYKAAVAGDSEVSTGKFPVATTIVADIQADEPGISVARGSCTNGLGAASPKQVLVDTASTTTSVTLCTPSTSGTVWKLTGPLTGTPTIVDATLFPVSFTSGDITDSVRAAAVQGDGRTVDSSTGVWPSTTNLVVNGGFESGATPWGVWAGSATITQDASTSLFGADSGRITNGSPGPITYGSAIYGIAVSANTAYTASAFLRSPVPGTCQIGIRWEDAGHANIRTDAINGSCTSPGWTRIATTGVSPANAAYADIYILQLSGATGATFNADGVQFEQSYVPTPYVNTNGSTASRAAGSVVLPTTSLSPSQGWVAIRIRMPFASAQDYGFAAGFKQPNLFALTDGTLTNRIHLFWYSGPQQWTLIVDRGGVSAAPASPTGNSFSAGQIVTVIGKWSSSQAGISINGAGFTTAAVGSGTWPTSGVTFDVGGFNERDGYQADADILWFAFGAGTLTDTDAATINGFGNTDPARANFPASAQETAVWDGTSANASAK